MMLAQSKVLKEAIRVEDRRLLRRHDPGRSRKFDLLKQLLLVRELAQVVLPCLELLELFLRVFTDRAAAHIAGSLDLRG